MAGWTPEEDAEIARLREERDAQAARLAMLEPWVSDARAVIAFMADPFDCALMPDEAEALAKRLKESAP